MALLGYIALLTLWSFCFAQDCGYPENIPTAQIIGEWNKESYPPGTEATYNCRPGYIKVGRQIWRCQDGGWYELNPLARCRSKPCGHPGDLENGFLELTRETEFVFGARVEYQCNDGYRMVSRLNYRECTVTGWSNYIPDCEVVKCLPVQSPKNGRIVMTGLYNVDDEFPYGHVLRFECDSPIFRLTEPKEIYCMKHGQWSSETPKCEEISCQEPSIPNGSVLSRTLNKKRYENKEKLQYECNSGYKHELKTFSECTENGWTPVPICTEIVCYFQNVVNGNLNPERNVYRENEKVNLICDPGYQPEYRDDFPKCTKSGWTPPLTCIHKQCDFPEIGDGKLYDTYLTYYKNHYFPMVKGKKIYYVCNDDFFTEEGTTLARIECTDQGWFPIPKCLKMCGEFTVTNGYPSSSANKYYIGDKAKYNCNWGFSTPEGMDDGEIECLPNGWSTQPTCIKTCSKPSLQHGRCYPDKAVFVAGDILQCECDDGYMSPERAIIERTECTERGWTKNPECVAITCPVDDEIPNGFSTPRRQEYENGHVLKFSCDENYYLKGEELRQCYYFGWFPQALPECKEITCNFTSQQNKLSWSPRNSKTYKNLDTVKFSCGSGSQINGSEVIQCYYFGWYPKPPKCRAMQSKKSPTVIADRNITNEEEGKRVQGQDIKCPPVPQLLNAETLPDIEYYSGNKVKYVCKENYTLQGREEIQCKNEKWSSPPRCIESKEKCPRSPKLDNTLPGSLQKEYYENGTVHFTCKPKFKLHGSESIQCRKGSWTSPPQCIEVQYCSKPSTIRNGKFATKLKSSYTDEDIVAYRCDNGYNIKSGTSNEITCIGGQWSSPPQCIGDSCDHPPEIEHGYFQNREKSSYDHGESVKYKCNPGYILDGNSEVRCFEGTWSIHPQCLDTSCGTAPNTENAELIDARKERYTSGEKVRYRCKEGFVLHEGILESTCQDRVWSQAPSCTKALDKCGRPPMIDNGDIEASPLIHYKSGESVNYRCKNYHIMAGSSRVTCLHGKWSKAPTCFEPCTASKEEMDTNKIILKWKDDSKLYVQHGDQIEFQCKRYHVFLPPLQEFRITCIRGYLEYPKCIGEYSCVLSLVELVKNNLELGKENTEVQHDKYIQFQCKSGFNPDSNVNLRIKCYNRQFRYPRCTSNTLNRRCGVPPAIENGDIKGTLMGNYDHGSSVEYQCSNYYRLTDPKPIVCNNGEWSKPPECINPCTLNTEKIFANNLQLVSRFGNEIYYKHMAFVNFECKWGYRFSSSTSSPLRAQCVNQTVIYPTCS
ncbi:complement factor H isoform X2 [Rhinatrema bivittatum]|uniref:complement factor H isoform X2 n=1 Tax=Rhinatrema bivittatum TaxID=194408 RepID=UPI00112640F8|nr:complement factor H isoform X2 [Rhinatrema bivittatum]